MNGIGLFSDSIHSISSVFATLELFFSHSFFSSFSFVYFSFAFPSFYSDLAAFGNYKVLYSLFQIPMNELNDFSRIEAYWLFPTEDVEN